MTKLLTEAFEKASSLSEDLQNQIAREIVEAMAGEERWDQTLAESQDQLDRLSEKAEREYRAGKTKEMGFDDL